MIVQANTVLTAIIKYFFLLTQAKTSKKDTGFA